MRAGAWGTLVGIAVWCAGCASQPVPPIVAAVAPGQARISITRTDEGPSWELSGGAQIAINGAHVAELKPGQSYTGGVPPGPASVTAEGYADIGQYTVKFAAVAGKTYTFQVSKRTERVVTALIGGVAGIIVDSAVNGDQSGAFKITQVEP